MTRAGILVALALLGVVVAALLPPIPQDPGYHAFADRRALAGVPNAFDVVSNVLFLAVGVAGLVWIAAGPLRGWDATSAGILLAGVAGTSIGSAWYHLAPDNARLVWDRLPMSVVFTTLFAIVIAERVGPRAGRVLLPPLVLAGMGSVLYWALRDDLRPYGVVQFFPMVAIPFLLLAYPTRYGAGDLWCAGIVYAVSKTAEHFDAAIFALGGIVSGHTLKHLLAGTGSALILRWIVRRARH